VPSGFTGFGLMSEVAFLSGSNIKLEAPTFLLGDLNQNFVSGSSGNIEISSSKFHVDSKNDIFSVGQPTGSRIQFDGNDLVMSSSKFFLGSELNFVSASNNNIEIFSKNFHLSQSGDIVTRGDLSATKGVFRDINVMGALVPNERIQDWTPSYNSEPNFGLVETWIPTGSGTPVKNLTPSSNIDGVSSQRFGDKMSGKLHEISSSTWGWTVESSGDSDRDVVWSDTSDASVLLTDNQNTTFSQMNPPPSIFKAVYQQDGLTLPDSGSKPAHQLYDALAYRHKTFSAVAPDTYTPRDLGNQDGIPKIGITENLFKIRSGIINLPLTQTDVFEINLEFVSRDAGNFGGFFNTLTVRILKASDNSILYTESKNHKGSIASWTKWSIPIVQAAGLVTLASVSAASDPYVIIDEIKIELQTTVGNHSGGGGTLDGVILTEMRLRRSPFFAFISTGTLAIDTITRDFLSDEVRFDSDVKFESEVEFDDDIDAGVINASRVVLTDYLTANGGVHVGGTSDPGTDNLVVDGDASVAGHFTGGGLRGYYFFGESTSFTATRYLDMAHGVQSSTNDAIPLIRDGSITGISTNYSVTSVTENPLVSAFSTVTLHVRINNTSVKTMSLVSNSTGQKNTRTTQAINTAGDTFSAGDKLQVSITIADVTAGSTPSAVEYDDFTCYIEITYDD